MTTTPSLVPGSYDTRYFTVDTGLVSDMSPVTIKAAKTDGVVSFPDMKAVTFDGDPMGPYPDAPMRLAWARGILDAIEWAYLELQDPSY